MSERKPGTWLSSVTSVVGNISGLWSRSPRDGQQDDGPPSSKKIAIEVESDHDEDSGDEFKDAYSNLLVPPQFHAAFNGGGNRREITKESVRYLSPSVLASSSGDNHRVASQQSGFVTTPISTRKRAADWDKKTSDGERSDSRTGERRRSRILYAMERDGLKEFGFREQEQLADYDQSAATTPSVDLCTTPTPSFTHRAMKSVSNCPMERSAFASSGIEPHTPRVSRPPSSTSSSLTNKTKTVLSYLEAVYGNRGTSQCLLNTMGHNETWFGGSSNCSSYVPPPRRSMNTSYPRGRLITKMLESGSQNQKPLWSLPRPFDYVPQVASEESNSKIPSVGGAERTEPVDDDMGDSLPPIFVDAIDSSAHPVSNGNKQGEGAKDRSPESSPEFIGKTGFGAHFFDDDRVRILTPNGEFEIVDSPSPPPDESSSQKNSDLVLFSFASPVRRGPMVVHESGEECTKAKPIATITEISDSEEDSGEDDEAEPSSNADAVPKSGSVSKTDAKDTSKCFGEANDSFASVPVVESQKNNGFPAEKQIESPKKHIESPKKQIDSSTKPIDSSPKKQNECSTDPSTATTLVQKDWSCPMCFVSVKGDAQTCPCCSYSNKKWTCKECFVPNAAEAKECVCCGASRFPATATQGVTSSVNSSTNVFGNRTFKPVANTTGVSFGFGLSNGGEALAKSAEPTSETPVSFGVSSTAEKGFSFGIGGGFGFPNTSTENAVTTVSAVTTEPATSSVSTAPFIASAPSCSTSGATFAEAPPAFNLVGANFGRENEDTAQASKPSPAFAFTGKPLFSSTQSHAAAPSFGFGNSASTPSLLTFGSASTTSPSTFGVTAVSQAPAATTTSFNSFSFKGPFDQKAVNNAAPEAKGVVFGSSVEMGSPEQSPPPAAATNAVGFSFGNLQQPQQQQQPVPLFAFGGQSSFSSGAPSTGGLFSSNSSGTLGGGASSFQFGSLASKQPTSSSEKPSTEAVPPMFGGGSVPSFNFGGNTSAASTSGFVFGAPAATPSFSFGSQPAPQAGAFGFPAANDSFGNGPQNFFSAGSSTSSSMSAGSRRYLKAKRTRK